MSSYETETMQHKMKVQIILSALSREFLVRGRRHDSSKLKSPEKEIYSEHHEELRIARYGTPEYNRVMEKIKPATQHHYQENDHHPEHFKNGFFDMNLIQITEMVADWIAVASEKGTDVIADLPTLMQAHDIPENYYMVLKNTAEKLKEMMKNG